MKYKGYVGVVSFDADKMVFHGEVIGINDVIKFQAKSAEELKKEFEISIDEYLKVCKQQGKKPGKPYSGNFQLRIKAALHAKLALQAKLKGVSLNSYINEKLQD